ncbi:hypothetical protein Tsubulata_051510 [Turnera subulata]|uniref:HMA domain-containing protein n=1 Tax=Turnera subulata TaxID=218843 RepID=A0A9Q0GEN0_9ROSI|nr:hypothetical protein Tsubulata_051510 [Turnera subulata]
MATVSAFSVLHSIWSPSSRRIQAHSTTLHFQAPGDFRKSSKHLTFRTNNQKRDKNLCSGGVRKLRAVETEGLVPEGAEETQAEQQATVSVPVSPSDNLTIFFQAEGMLNEEDIPKVTRALERIEGVSDLKVQASEGVATVELSKQTTVQATGVASNLVEIIQRSGFKLQTLNLSFPDEEPIVLLEA